MFFLLQISVLFFAKSRELVGTGVQSFQVEQELTSADLHCALLRQFPS
jgi:hypothetical protein